MSIFKACDIRGVYPDELDERAAEAVGRAVGAELTGAECLVGGDARPSTPALKEAACRGLAAAGAHAIDVGTTPTPVAYWARRRLRVRGAVIITASHNPPQYNGIKFMLGDLPVTPEDVQRVRARVEAGEFSAGRGSVRSQDVRGDYLAFLAERFAGTGGGLKAVVDAGNGVAGDWAPEAFRAAGYRVEQLYCNVDGAFPDRSPNPSTPQAVRAAADTVRETGADFAACFDGDADRAVFLDERGCFVPAEEAIILFARDILRARPGAGVVYDLKCTRMVAREIEHCGGRPVMERSGHAFIKHRLIAEGAAFAGEASGHFFFEELAGDDGIYAALRMGELVAASGGTLSALRASVPPYFISEDIRLPRPGGDARQVVEALCKAFADRPQDHMDGVRIEFDGGWALCRPSVTEPVLTVRVEGESPARLEEIRRIVLDAIPEVTSAPGRMA
jgi:phosphomannomutase/phosphoglucomutase